MKPTVCASPPEASPFRFRSWPRLLCPVLLSAFVFVTLSACDSAPEDTYARLTQAAQNGEWEAVYALLDESSQAHLDGLVQDALQFEADSNGVDVRQQYGRLEGAALFARLADRHPQLYQYFDVPGYRLLDTEVTGDEAQLTIRINEGRGEQVPAVVRLRREGGTWKVRLP